MNQTQEYYQNLIDKYLNDNKTHYNNYKEGINELQISDKKFTNRYQENIDAADAINREFRLGVLLQEDFANGFDEFYVSSTVEHDYCTLPNLGFSTGSMPTGSAGFGVAG